MNKISAKHFILFIFSVTYISLKTYPSLFIKEGGRDTWLYTLIIYLIFLFYYFIILIIKCQFFFTKSNQKSINFFICVLHLQKQIYFSPYM